MAYVRIYYHREPKRLAPHVRYIARRPESDGLRGLGSAFRELRGDVDACVRLLQEHAAQARVQAGKTTREGPFVRLLFTLPTELAARVARADARVPDGARLVLRDAVEATFRSVGRQLQGVYAVHFHAAQRAEHGHVHVDLSPLDSLGRPTFVTKEQRARFRDGWEREVVKALERVARRDSRKASTPARDATRDDQPSPGHTPPRAVPERAAAEADVGQRATQPAGAPRANTATRGGRTDRGGDARTPRGTSTTPASTAPSATSTTRAGARSASAAHASAAAPTSTPATTHAVNPMAGSARPSNTATIAQARATTSTPIPRARHPQAPRRQRLRYVPVLTEWMLGRSRTPLVDLFFRALVARAERRQAARPRPLLAVRFALGWPVPRVTVRPTTPLVRPALLRWPSWS